MPVLARGLPTLKSSNARSISKTTTSKIQQRAVKMAAGSVKVRSSSCPLVPFPSKFVTRMLVTLLIIVCLEISTVATDGHLPPILVLARTFG